MTNALGLFAAALVLFVAALVLFAAALVLIGFGCGLVVVGDVLWQMLVKTYAWWAAICEVRCPQCQGTGMCLNPDGTLNYIPGKPPHSCCGDCGRTHVPYSQVDPRYQYALDEGRVLIGVGWVPGSPWQRLWRGGPRKRLGVLP